MSRKKEKEYRVNEYVKFLYIQCTAVENGGKVIRLATLLLHLLTVKTKRSMNAENKSLLNCFNNAPILFQVNEYMQLIQLKILVR